MKKRTLIIVCLVLALVLIALGAVAGYKVHYRNTHVFYGEAVYEKDALSVDLRGTGADIAYYEGLKEAMPGTEILWELPFQGGFLPLDTTSLTLTSLSSEDVQLLDYLTQLQTVDATGCTDYEQILALQARRPECQVTYQVTLGGVAYPQDVQELTFADADVRELMEQFVWLPELKTVTFEALTMEAEDLIQLVQMYPEIAFSWEVEVLGQTYPWDVTALDFSNTPLEGIEELEAALAYLPMLETVEVHNCGIDYETLGQWRERQKDAYKVVWTVHLSWGIDVRTDETTFMPVMMNDGCGKVWDYSMVDLKYCNEMICVDVGHMPITHCDWAAYMPNLKYLIVADTGITSIEGVRGLQNLIYLEAFTTPLTDYSPLLECPNIKDLNIVNSGGDPEVIAQLTSLERLWWGGFYRVSLTEEEKQMVREALPNTDCQLNVLNPTTLGWRKGKLYYEMRDVLGMPYFGQ